MGKLCNAFNPDVIHHLAAVNGTKRFHKEADLVVDVNVNGTRNAIEFAQKYNAKLAFYSSPESFGEQEKMPLSNHSESVFPPAHLHQRHSYGASKHVGDYYVTSHIETVSMLESLGHAMSMALGYTVMRTGKLYQSCCNQIQ